MIPHMEGVAIYIRERGQWEIWRCEGGNYDVIAAGTPAAICAAWRLLVGEA